MKSLSIALLLLALVAGALGGPASAERLSWSNPTKDNYSYVPGEVLTFTYEGLNTTAGYDFRIWNSTGVDVWNITNQTYAGGAATVPVTIPDRWNGTYTFSAYRNSTGTLLNETFFTVRLFTLTASADRNTFLAGDTITVFYHTSRLDSQSPLGAGHGMWRMTVQRDNGTGFVDEPLGNSFTDTRGSFAVPLPPTTRTGYYNLVVTYNDTADDHSVNQNIFVSVGTMNVNVNTDRTNYAPGDSVLVSASAAIVGTLSNEPISGVHVNLTIQTRETPSSPWVENQTFSPRLQDTDIHGQVSFLIPLPTGIADGTEMRARVIATRGAAPQEATDQFSIIVPTGFSYDLTINKTSYKPGETLKAHLAFISTNTTLVNGAQYQWTISDSSTGRVFTQVYTPGTPTGADFEFPIPADFSGSLYVTVSIFTPDDEVYFQSDYVTVFSYALLINPSKTMYNAGDRIDVNVSFVTDRVTSASFYWTVTPGSGGDPIAKGTIPAGGKTANFGFNIPADPADDYDISVAAEGNGVVAQDGISVSKAKYTALQITVPDKTYRPGDTVTIHYVFVTVGGATPPTTTTIYVVLGNYPYAVSGSGRSFEVDTSQRLDGDLQYTIPATTAGTADLAITAYAGSYGSSSTTVFVRPTQGASPASAASTTAVWGIVIAVFALVVAGFALWRKPGRGTESAAPRSSYDDMKSSGGFKVAENESPKPKDRVILQDDRPPVTLNAEYEHLRKKDGDEPPKSL